MTATPPPLPQSSPTAPRIAIWKMVLIAGLTTIIISAMSFTMNWLPTRANQQTRQARELKRIVEGLSSYATDPVNEADWPWTTSSPTGRTTTTRASD